MTAEQNGDERKALKATKLMNQRDLNDKRRSIWTALAYSLLSNGVAGFCRSILRSGVWNARGHRKRIDELATDILEEWAQQNQRISADVNIVGRERRDWKECRIRLWPTDQHGTMKNESDKASVFSQGTQRGCVNKLAILVTEDSEKVKGIVQYLTRTYPGW